MIKFTYSARSGVYEFYRAMINTKQFSSSIDSATR